ncbi:Carbohydrate sulfotransferase 15 [Geodia barretti]|uniref:Carbohydrate sulfotransferase 15 n=1 Tax=Geodia barretti TaxID=519541 RepID=A0AA35T7X6_GEOBA|nr:Carbohydrate sulfotransferase 15 [Geodia barretti]
MGKPSRLLLVFLSLTVIPNAVLVILKTSNPQNIPRALSNVVEAGCDCRGSRVFAEAQELAAAPRPTVNYSQVASETPRRANKTKYSRLGTQLQLDYAKMCPRGSLMLGQRSQFVPNHLDCPSLFIVGARKAGTSSLYMYVSRHPSFKGILLDRGPKVGETYYFSSHWKSWKWSQYMKLFEHTSHYTTGESSVGYLTSCNVPERLWRSCGKQAKIVILLRDPIKRLESNYRMRIRLQLRGYSNNTKASTMVNLELERFINAALKNGADIQSVEHSWEKFRCLFNPSSNMVFEGLYYVHIMNWLCNFPPENILILNSEEFFHNTRGVFEEVIEFLGLPPLDRNTTAFITSTSYNTGRGGQGPRQQLSEMDRKKLRVLYKHTNQPLLNLLDWEGFVWS